MKITFNSPFILTFALIATALFAIGTFLGGPLRITVLQGHVEYNDWQWYPSLFLYPFSHANVYHLVSNFSIILLLGPILERKNGTKRLMFMTFVTALITAIIHILISESSLIGASGIVFMYIVSASLVDRQGKEVPLTFILVLILFLGQEILSMFRDDNISQLAHISGGLLGILFDYFWKK